MTITSRSRPRPDLWPPNIRSGATAAAAPCAAWPGSTSRHRLRHAQPALGLALSRRARLASAHRSGRVLLAGDAAHIHYPAGGQGLNTGIQDAVNLGWKLALGEGPPLDSYERERRPIAARVLDNTRAQTALTRVDPQTSALRGVLESLIALPEVNRSLAEMVSALDIRYPLGEGTGHRAPAGVPLREGRPVLLGSPGARPLPPNVLVRSTGGPQMLIRPDGYVAWVESQGEAALTEALNRWC